MKISKSMSGASSTPSGAKLLATALAAGTFAVLSVFLAFAIYHDLSEQGLRERELEKYLQTVGEATAWGADNWLSNRISLAENLANAIGESFDGTNGVKLVQNPVYEQKFIWTYFGEVNGQYHIWPEDEMPADYDPRTRPWYAAALLARKSTLTEPYYDISTNVETITVVSPVYRQSELLGVVGADFSTQSLGDVLKETNLGGLGHAYLVAGNGKILAHPNRDLVSKDLSHAYPGHRPEIESGVQYLDDMKAPEIVTFHKISSLDSVDWYLALSVDKKAAFQSIYEFRTTAAIATLAAALVLVLVLGLVLHRVLVRPLMNARIEADAANVAKSEFLASMSHEIRTPMNGVLGMAEVLSNTNLDKHQHELASIIVSSGNALLTVINDILDFSKLDAGKLRLSSRSFNLRQTVFEVATMMQARALEQDIELIVRYAPELPEGVIADDSRLRQVLGNLIGNAVKFTEHGYVLIDVRGVRKGEELDLEFSVQDTGIGIPDAEIPRMFEKFEQADGSHTRKFGGTGLGLAICKNLVELMGGEIGAESEVGKGSRFWFSLSLPVDETIKSLPVLNQSTFEGVRLLAVDDNPVNRRVLEELIAGWGFRSTIVGDPVRAMAALEKSVSENDPYHAALLDFQMPGEDGLSLGIRMKNHPNFASLPVIILSSIDDTGIRDAAQHANITAYLSKPVRPSQLMDTLAQILSDEATSVLKDICPSNKKLPSENHADLKKTKSIARAKLLVAEDNMINQMVLTKFIDETFYEVIIAENGEKALELYKSDHPALVFMDLSMPIMDGFKATRSIRAYETKHGMRRTPIIATTAHVLEEDRQRCKNAGMDDFLSKPIKKAALDHALKRWIDKVEAVLAEKSA
ncbi:response regulator [Hyphococcus sp.]|uniref:response regulator n=1 Tax=Hyphococcus sp. TaxID=2038636 RepID=UPI003CCC168A